MDLARRIVIAWVSAWLVLGGGVAAAQAGADPESFDKREFVCPLGGGRFTQDVGYHSVPLAIFPDGSYPGDEHIDVQIPVCPDNGLAILPDYEAMAAPGNDRMKYADYSAAELALLPALIADPAYVALKADGRHVQALWLATRLGRSARTRFILLQRSTWAATDPALRRRLVERLAAEGPALIEAAELSPAGRRFHLYYIVNALRELGRFDEALALMETIDRQGPPVPMAPDPDQTYGPDDYSPQMRAVIGHRDMDRFPVGLMPSRWGDATCKGEEMPPPYGPRTAAARAACARRGSEKARRDAEVTAVAREEERLLNDHVALDRACAATAQGYRPSALHRACRSVAEEREIDSWVKEGPRLAAACETSNWRQQASALLGACNAYRIARQTALDEAIAADDSAFAILCPGAGDQYVDDRALRITVACDRAAWLRRDKGLERQLADTMALDARCAAVADGRRDRALSESCLRRAGSSSLVIEARARAAAVIAKAKAEGTYPKGDPLDED